MNAEPHEIRPRRRHDLWACAALALVVLCLFGDVLFIPGDRVAAGYFSDVQMYFASSRTFGFDQIRHGNLPLWDPHLFSGTPYVGNFQSAMLYPPNLVYIALPLAKAINADLALHVFLFGLFTFLWGRNRGLRALPAFFSAACAMLSSSFFLHVPAGSLTMLAALAWAPLVFLSIDHLMDRPRRAWAFVGALAVTMQLLAGLPQGVFLTCLAAAGYCALRFPRSSQKPATLVTLAVLAAMPLFLSAVQLWTGVDTASEGTRAGGLPFDFASSYSFAPENLLTLLVPGFFGDFQHAPYWGRWWPWEISMSIGVTGLMLAAYGALFGTNRERWRWLAMFALLMLFALGRYTPVYGWLYRMLPGVDHFRGPGRIVILATLFLALLAGLGLQRLLEDQRRIRILAPVLVVVALALLGGALAVRNASTGGPESRLAQFVNGFRVQNETVAVPLKPEQVPEAASFSERQLLISASTILALAVLLWLSARYRWPRYAVLALGMAELLLFAGTQRGTSSLSAVDISDLQSLRAADPGDYRVFDNPLHHNRVQRADVNGIWGYDPVALKRYVEFVARIQGLEGSPLDWPLNPACVQNFTLNPLLRLLRFKYALPPQGVFPAPPHMPPLPRFLLVHACAVVPDRLAAMQAMEDPTFDPLRTVVIEEPPVPTPEPGDAAGQIAVLDQDTDHVTLHVDTPRAAILLMTDSYSRGWRVRAVNSGDNRSYRLLPADGALRAVPLPAGAHDIRIEYRPQAFRYGALASGISTALVLLCAFVSIRKDQRRIEGIPSAT